MKFLNRFFLPSVAKMQAEAMADAAREAWAAERLAEDYECEAGKLRLKATMLHDRIATITDAREAEHDAAIIAAGADK